MEAQSISRHNRHMRVLFVTLRLPGHAMRGDQLRAFEHLRWLGARHEVTLLAGDGDKLDASALERLAPYCARIVRVGRRRVDELLGVFKGLLGNAPLQVAVFDQGAMHAALSELLETSRFDLVHLQLARLGPLLAHVAPLPCVIDLVDALSLNMLRRAQRDRGPMRWIAAREAASLARYEQTLLAGAAALTVCAPADAAAIGPSDKVHLVRNGVDLAHFNFRFNASDAPQLVFVGNLGYFPNIEAVTWFVQSVLPLVRSRCPEVCLDLVGARPARAVRRLVQGRSDVRLIGEVADVLPHLHAATVAVVPLRAGSGQQLKLIEAMAAGVAVVSSPLSAQGLAMHDGEELLVADDAEAMAAAIVRLLGDRALRARLAHAARARVQNEFGWERSADELEAVWQRVVANRSR
jgi:sugar transferase (PEP-CTERM/EpsH1 system associated)